MSNVTIDIVELKRVNHQVTWREPFCEYLSSGVNGHNGCIRRAYMEHPVEYKNTPTHEYIYVIGQVRDWCKAAQP